MDMCMLSYFPYNLVSSYYHWSIVRPFSQDPRILHKRLPRHPRSNVIVFRVASGGASPSPGKKYATGIPFCTLHCAVNLQIENILVFISYFLRLLISSRASKVIFATRNVAHTAPSPMRSVQVCSVHSLFLSPLLFFPSPANTSRSWSILCRTNNKE